MVIHNLTCCTPEFVVTVYCKSKSIMCYFHTCVAVGSTADLTPGELEFEHHGWLAYVQSSFHLSPCVPSSKYVPGNKMDCCGSFLGGRKVRCLSRHYAEQRLYSTFSTQNDRHFSATVLVRLGEKDHTAVHTNRSSVVKDPVGCPGISSCLRFFPLGSLAEVIKS